MVLGMSAVAVLGAGQMGVGGTAVFAQAVPVYLLNRAPLSKAEKALNDAINLARTNSLRFNVTPGTLENDLERCLGEADLVFETMTEDLALKRQLFQQVDRYRKPGSIVASGSSGLSIKRMAEGMSRDFQRHFVGIHLYNPPTRLVAAEIVPGPDTAPEVVEYTGRLMGEAFRRVVLYAKDTPGYAGNRIGLKSLCEAAHLAPPLGVATVDYLFGRYTGRLLPPLATIDLIGWDVFKAVVDNIYANTNDEAHESFRLPGYMEKLMQAGHLGDKTPAKGGFFRRVGPQLLTLDPLTGKYLELQEPRVRAVEAAKEMIHVGSYREALQSLLDGAEGTAEVRRWLLSYISYAGMRNGEVSDMSGINRVMGWGFNWVPPDALTDLLGVGKTRALLQQEGLPIPPHLADHRQGRLYNEADDVGRYLNGR